MNGTNFPPDQLAVLHLLAQHAATQQQLSLQPQQATVNNMETLSRAIVSSPATADAPSNPATSDNVAVCEASSSSSDSSSADAWKLPPEEMKLCRLPLPYKLYSMLNDPRNETIVSWLPGGRVWKVHDILALVNDVLPRYFDYEARNLHMFERLLTLWNFSPCVEAGANTYFHELFAKKSPRRLSQMRPDRKIAADAAIEVAGESRQESADFSTSNPVQHRASTVPALGVVPSPTTSVPQSVPVLAATAQQQQLSAAAQLLALQIQHQQEQQERETEKQQNVQQQQQEHAQRLLLMSLLQGNTGVMTAATSAPATAPPLAASAPGAGPGTTAAPKIGDVVLPQTGVPTLPMVQAMTPFAQLIATNPMLLPPNAVQGTASQATETTKEVPHSVGMNVKVSKPGKKKGRRKWLPKLGPPTSTAAVNRLVPGSMLPIKSAADSSSNGNPFSAPAANGRQTVVPASAPAGKGPELLCTNPEVFATLLNSINSCNKVAVAVAAAATVTQKTEDSKADTEKAQTK